MFKILPKPQKSPSSQFRLLHASENFTKTLIRSLHPIPDGFITVTQEDLSIGVIVISIASRVGNVSGKEPWVEIGSGGSLTFCCRHGRGKEGFCSPHINNPHCSNPRKFSAGILSHFQSCLTLLEANLL